MGAGLYEAAFATLTRLLARRAGAVSRYRHHVDCRSGEHGWLAADIRAGGVLRLAHGSVSSGPQLQSVAVAAFESLVAATGETRV